MIKKAVVLISGGLDSTTCLALAKEQGFELYAMSFAYGQKHGVELNAAKRIAEHFGVKNHKILDIAQAEFGASALTNAAIAVPEDKGEKEVPITYVPARNTIFLAYALGWAEVLDAQAIFIGASGDDYPFYPDCRPEYYNALQQVANLATKAGIEGQGVQIYTPLIHLTKAETIIKGLALGVDYSLTISCYQADLQGRACGRCNSCTLRKKGFVAAQVPDSTRYVAAHEVL